MSIEDEAAMSRTLQGISSMATSRILADLAGAYEAETGQRIVFQSLGGVVAARRIREGEPFDVVALAADALEKLEAENHILPGSRAGFARSAIAVAVKAGSPHPRLGNEEEARKALLDARRVAYSTGPSGVHLLKLMAQWGVADAVAERLVQAPPGIPVAAMVARGEAEFGLQQLSELLHEPGVEIAGLLPAAIQSITLFAAGVGARSANISDARDFCAYLASSKAADAIRRHGMEPN
jgi:molybdate transport system substrate-binding protein